MYMSTGEKLEKELEKLPENHKSYGIQIINQCGHQCPLQGPEGTTEMMLKYYEIFKAEDERNDNIKLDEEIPEGPKL